MVHYIELKPVWSDGEIAYLTNANGHDHITYYYLRKYRSGNTIFRIDLEELPDLIDFLGEQEEDDDRLPISVHGTIITPEHWSKDIQNALIEIAAYIKEEKMYRIGDYKYPETEHGVDYNNPEPAKKSVA